MVKCPPLESEVSSSLPGRVVIVYFLFLFLMASVRGTNTNDIHEEIKRRINMGYACYYSLEKILLFRLLSKKLKLIHIKLLQLNLVIALSEGPER